MDILKSFRKKNDHKHKTRFTMVSRDKRRILFTCISCKENFWVDNNIDAIVSDVP